MAVVPTVADDDKVEKDVRIGQGGDQYWKIKTHGKINIKVNVIEGGAVDVLITKDEPVGFVLYYEKWTNIRNLEKTFNTGEDTEVYLLIDNSNKVGVDTVGEVRVHVEWEITGEAGGLLLSILIPMIIIIVVVVGIVVRIVGRGGRSTGPDEGVIEDIYVDERGRPISSVVRHAEGPASGRGPREPQWCPDCGAQMRPDPRTGGVLCLQCATKARASPRPPRQDE